MQCIAKLVMKFESKYIPNLKNVSPLPGHLSYDTARGCLSLIQWSKLDLGRCAKLKTGHPAHERKNENPQNNNCTSGGEGSRSDRSSMTQETSFITMPAVNGPSFQPEKTPGGCTPPKQEKSILRKRET